MSKFVTKEIKDIKGRQKFEELVILDNSLDLKHIELANVRGVWQEYKESLEEKYSGSFDGLTAIMNRVANLQSLPDTKFRDITPHGEPVKEYEFKYQDLRAYGIKIPNGKLILLGGFKNKQKGDIAFFRGLKKKYLNSL